MKKSNETTAHNPEALLHDLRALVAEAEKLMAGSAAEDSDLFENLRDRFAAAQERCGELYEGARKTITVGAQNTDRVIRANPYQSLAVALGAGLLFGLFIARRK